MHNRLKLLRETLGLKQGKFAEQLGMSQAYLSDIEHGRKGFSATLLMALDNKNVNLHWLLTGEGQMLYSPDYPLSSDLSDKIKKIVHELPLKRQKMILNYAEDQQNLSKLFNE